MEQIKKGFSPSERALKGHAELEQDELTESQFIELLYGLSMAPSDAATSPSNSGNFNDFLPPMNSQASKKIDEDVPRAAEKADCDELDSEESEKSFCRGGEKLDRVPQKDVKADSELRTHKEKSENVSESSMREKAPAIQSDKTPYLNGRAHAETSEVGREVVEQKLLPETSVQTGIQNLVGDVTNGKVNKLALMNPQARGEILDVEQFAAKYTELSQKLFNVSASDNGLKQIAAPIDGKQLQNLIHNAINGTSSPDMAGNNNNFYLPQQNALKHFAIARMSAEPLVASQPCDLKSGVLMKQLPGEAQTKIIEQIQKALEVANSGRDTNALVVRLDPPDLGQVTVKLVYRRDELFARFTPENPEVEALLRSKVADISSILLSGSSIKADNIHIAIGNSEADLAQGRFGQFFRRERHAKGGKATIGAAMSSSVANEEFRNVPSAVYANQKTLWVA